MPLLNYIRGHLCFVLLCAGGRNYPTVKLATHLSSPRLPACLSAKSKTVNQKKIGRDEKALIILRLLNCPWHFVTDDILSHQFNACTNFYLFSKCDNAEILKLEIISSSFHQQQEPELGVQGEVARAECWDFPSQAAGWDSPLWRGNEITNLQALGRNLAEGAIGRSSKVTWSTLWASTL